MRKILRTLLSIVFILSLPISQIAANSGWSFLPNQRDCKLVCMNGGVCAYEVTAPENHKCICFIGMWEGEQCEVAVGGENTERAAASAEEERPSTHTELIRVEGGSSSQSDEEDQHEYQHQGRELGLGSAEEDDGGVPDVELRQHPANTDRKWVLTPLYECS